MIGDLLELVLCGLVALVILLLAVGVPLGVLAAFVWGLVRLVRFAWTGT
jgi:thiamine transporter ThiT